MTGRHFERWSVRQMRIMRDIVGKVVTFILVTMLVALACFVTSFVIMVAPIPGISMLAGGLAL